MEDTAFESLENALAHHNEWVGQSIKLSVHETPEVDELVEVDLAESIGKSRAYLKHSLSLELADKVRLLIRYLDIWIFGYLDIWIFGYLDIWIFDFMACHFNILTFVVLLLLPNFSVTGFPRTWTRIPQHSG
jgi:hypothetical protein